MSKIVFVNPPLTLKDRYGNLALAGDRVAPLGLCGLAAVCRENNFEVELIDVPALRWDYQKTCDKIINTRANYVGITAVTISIYNAAELARLIKQRDRSVVTIIGGPHLTAAPEETLRRFPQFDIGVIGEAETTIVELLKAYENNEALDKVAGLIIRKDGSFLISKKRPFIEDLDRLPMPAWDLLTNFPKAYPPSAIAFSRLPAGSLVTSRGCSGRCIFCDRNVFGNHCRAFSAEYVMAMIKRLYYHYGVREIEMLDDNFMLFRQRLIRLCQMLIEEDLDLSWSCQSRVDYATPEVLRLMQKAGCWHIAYGIESGSQKILDFLKKDISLSQIESAIRWTKEAKVRVWGYFMIGLPFETKETIRETIEFARRLDLDDFHIANFTPLPGADIYEKACRYGDFDDDWRKMNLWYPIFVPHGLTKKELIRQTKKAFKKFYLRPKTIISNFRLVKRPAYILRLIRGGLGLFRFLLEGER